LFIGRNPSTNFHEDYAALVETRAGAASTNLLDYCPVSDKSGHD
jgi:hypothetical protein